MNIVGAPAVEVFDAGARYAVLGRRNKRAP
jgi:hypothetical protein